MKMRNLLLFFLLILVLLLTACGNTQMDDGDSNPDPNTPYFDPIGSPSVTAGEMLNFTVNAHDPNNLNIILTSDGTLGPNLNPFTAGASFNATSGSFSWSTDANDVGTYNVQFTATNDAVPPVAATVNITLRVLAMTNTSGENLYVQYCQSCHGVNGAGGSAFTVRCSSEASIREALGLVSQDLAVGAMSGIAGQMSDPTTDIRDIAAFLEGFC